MSSCWAPQGLLIAIHWETAVIDPYPNGAYAPHCEEAMNKFKLTLWALIVCLVFTIGAPPAFARVQADSSDTSSADTTKKKSKKKSTKAKASADENAAADKTATASDKPSKKKSKKATK